MRAVLFSRPAVVAAASLGLALGILAADAELLRERHHAARRCPLKVGDEVVWSCAVDPVDEVWTITFVATPPYRHVVLRHADEAAIAMPTEVRLAGDD